ncbi:tRNA (N6-isopentenyl adenosine(37)-C2)-methylthiotransferase MiaB [Candidatus Omnitrophota bacterium]
MKRKVYIRTFGCQMNIRDSEIILGMLQCRGYQQASSLEDADIVLFNTCSVRQHAEQRVWGQVGALKKEIASADCVGLAMTRKKKIIGVVGCMAQNFQEEIFRRLPHVDFVCGPANIYDIPDLINQAGHNQHQALAVEKKQRPLLSDAYPRKQGLKAFVSIMYGCDNFCAYCIVPYVRGREISRPAKHIIQEVKDLAATGTKEVTLLGQNVNSYGRDLGGKLNFVRLLEKLDKIKDIERIRFMTSHPKDASKPLFRALRDLPKACEHLHLPLQSGSDKILKLMNRRYSLRHYLKSIDCLRSLIPHCAITTDIIVGFPGETKADFQETVAAMEKIKFDQAFIFKYSPRPKTKAAGLEDSVSRAEKQARNQVLLKLQEQGALKKNNQLLGKSLQVLVEGKGSGYLGNKKQAMLQGRSRTNKVTLFPGPDSLIAEIVDVKINRVTARTLIGEEDAKKD